ncbi:MAG TPA: lamin tail domain-containing protein [Polyangium sp.]|nr:lamin tail domain-containing protein [Polyangium sp.]
MPAAAGTVCAEGTGTKCDGQGKCVECVAPTDCATGTACQTRECNAGVCGLADSPAGTEVSDPTAGDCMNQQCDAMGNEVTGTDDTDVPMPVALCKIGKCMAGVPSTENAPQDTMCGAGAMTKCDAMGNCVGCTGNTDCGMATECNVPTCATMTCTNVFTADGTNLMMQTPNDCKVAQCNGMGGTKQSPDDTDVPLDDNNPCTDQACNAGMPDFPPSALGTSCNGNMFCNGQGLCVECNVGVDCISGVCGMNMCQPPEVLSVAPTDAQINAPVTSSIAITFTGKMDPATLVGQTTLGMCTGSIQFSVDDFATCYPLASAMPTMSPDGKTATVVPAPGLSYGTKYKVRVTTGAMDLSGTALAADFTQLMGFTTEVPQSTCGGSVVISQVYVAGGNNGAAYTNDYVELHNRGNTPVNLAGWTLQYAAQMGTTWSGPTLNGTIAPGGYYLIQLASGGATGMMLPTPDLTNGTGLSASNGGKIALVSSTTTLSGGCPTGGQIRDFVGYGNAGCFEGTGTATLPSATQAIFRKTAGCTDTGQNGMDTELLAAAPRNSMTTAAQCDCSVAGTNGTANESDITVEMDFCNVQFPTEVMVMAGQMTPDLFGRVYEVGFTEAMGANGAIIAEVGYGPANVNPENQSGFQFFPATYNVQSGNDDEYKAAFMAPATAGSYRYVYRFRRDATSWTYCDKNGSGSNTGLSFEIHELPILTVMP